MQSVCSTRHLIYYVYPVKGNGVWQRNIRALKQRADIFNGIRRVIVAEQLTPLPLNNHHPVPERARGQVTDSWEAVRDALGPDFNVSRIQHSATLRETAAFPTLLQEVLQYDGVTFFGHAKGVSYKEDDKTTPVNHWTSLLYSANLDFWPLVEQSLETHAMYGVLREYTNAGTKRVACRENGTLVYRKIFSQRRWHFTGTFFWFNNARVKAVPHDVDPSWLGVELWPGKVFSESEAYCPFANPVRQGAPYTWKIMQPILDQFRKWSEDNARFRRPGVTSSPWEDYLCQ